jgi:hypothetical protein
VLGETEVAARLPGALLGSLAVVFQYLLGRCLFGRRAGWLSGLLLVLSVHNIYYSRDAHYYGVFQFFGTAAFYYFCRLLLSDGRRVGLWVAYAVMSFGMLFNHYIGGVACVANAVTVGLALLVHGWRWGSGGVRARWLRGASPSMGGEGGRGCGQTDGGRVSLASRSLPAEAAVETQGKTCAWEARVVLRFAIGFAIAGVAVLIAMSPFLGHLITTASGKNYVGPGGSLRLKITSELVHFIFTRQGFGNGAGLALFVLLLAAGIAWQGRQSKAWLGLSLFWNLFPYVLFAIVEFGYGVNVRYFTFTQPALILLYAMGAEALWVAGIHLARGRWWGYAPAAAAALVWCVRVLPAYPAYYSMNSYDDPKRDLAAWMRGNLPEGAIVLVGNQYNLRWVPGYYPVPNCTFAHVAYWDYFRDFVDRNIRGRLQAFLEKYPEAALEGGEYFEKELGPWEFPSTHFGHHQYLVNWGGVKLARLGLYRLELDIPPGETNVTKMTSLYRVVHYNTEADLIARARARGAKAFRQLVRGFGFVLTRDWRDLMVTTGESVVAVHELDAGPATVQFKARAYALGADRLDISVGAGVIGTWSLANGQMAEYGLALTNLPPGRTEVRLRVSGPGQGQQPPAVLFDNIWVE